MDSELIVNSAGIKVLTPMGLKLFSGIARSWHETIVEVKTANRILICSLKHKFLIGEEWIEARALTVDMSLTTAALTPDRIVHVEIKNDPQFLYDLIDVDGGNAYVTNGIISHNCEFLSSDALLIDTRKLHALRSVKPLHENMGFKFWTDKIGGRGKTYLVGVDPATGNGNDFTAIEVFEFPSLVQVAELRMNTVKIPLIYAKIKWLLKYLRQPSDTGRAEVMWSFERNGVGEALVAMIQNDDSIDGGVHLDGVELYNESATRLGCYTTGSSKLVTLMQLKNMVEKIKGGLTIYSDTILEELKNFVATGGSYAARNGSTDDTVMACAIVMKLLNRLSSYDDKARAIVYEVMQPDADQIKTDDQFPTDEAIPFVLL